MRCGGLKGRKGPQRITSLPRQAYKASRLELCRCAPDERTKWIDEAPDDVLALAKPYDGVTADGSPR